MKRLIAIVLFVAVGCMVPMTGCKKDEGTKPAKKVKAPPASQPVRPVTTMPADRS
ncbi:MAG: hypothetical protein PHU85_08530 [Phycisphaerae bacterium]|nr:hypothetical protein [Phycisphaerae bacterium]